MSQIPAAGQWLEAQRGLLHAWHEAQRQYRAQQSGLMNQYGFTGNGQVDDKNTTGLYQQLMRQEGSQVDQAQSGIQGRGFNAAEGLGARLMEPVRYGQGVQDSQFMQNLMGQQQKLQDRLMNQHQSYQTGLYDVLRRAAQQAQRQRRFSTAGG